MDKIIIYLFGNPLLDFDSLPLDLISDLRLVFPEIDFREVDPNENLKPIDKKMIIIDTIEGITEVTLVTKVDELLSEQMYSMHDLDLGFNLKLLQGIGLLEEVLIFGIPMKIEKQAALEQLVSLMRKTLF